MPQVFLLFDKPKFDLGELVLTESIKRNLKDPDFSKFLNQSLNRHALADWGKLEEEEKKENKGILENFSLIPRFRSSLNLNCKLYSSYLYERGDCSNYKRWVVSITTEYILAYAKFITTVFFRPEKDD